MAQEAFKASAFVIKPDELAYLNYLPPSHPRPTQIDWINRGTDQMLRPSSVEMLLRTLFNDIASPSVIRLHRSAGLRLTFSTQKERDTFVKAFAAAKTRDTTIRPKLVSAVFRERADAECAVAELKSAGIPDAAISLLWQMNKFIDPDVRWPEGHSKKSVAAAVAASGIVGAVLGVAVLAIPGVGVVAAAGAMAAAVPSVAAVSGIIAATGGAIARMLTDQDVDGISANFYEQQIRRGHVFVSVDIVIAEGKGAIAKALLRASGGRSGPRM